MTGGELPQVFMMDAPDDALAPKARAGTGIIWSRTKEPKIGAAILVRDRHGGHHVRQMHQGLRPGAFKAAPINPAYATLDSEADGLEVIAVWDGQRGGFEDL